MTQPFTYRIQFIPTGEYYYGVRYKKDCKPEDLWVKYFTSSSTVKQLIETHGKSAFRTEIRKVFNTPEEAIAWEGRVNKYTRIWPNYLNKTDIKALGNQFGKKGGLIGGQVSKNNQKGIFDPDNQKMRPIWGKAAGDKIVEMQRGIHDPLKPWLNDPVKVNNMKQGSLKGGAKTGSMPWWNNGIIDTKSIERPAGEGWIRGVLPRGRHWTNGAEDRVCEESPGKGWYLGTINTTTQGMTWWHNNKEARLFFTPPDDTWIAGKLPGASNWWTNEIEQIRQKECPGAGWRKGMLKKIKA